MSPMTEIASLLVMAADDYYHESGSLFLRVNEWLWEKVEEIGLIDAIHSNVGLPVTDLLQLKARKLKEN